jgi:serine/threonine-protein kinase
MELVEGQSLEKLIRGGRKFSPEEVTSLSIEIARALKVAHNHGIIHRDLKPANLLVADDAVKAGARIKLADFGIAKLFGAASQTAHGSIVGTAEFMAPEQAAGKTLDARADLYTLGLVMFTMIAGRPPFRGTQLTEIISKQLRDTPPRLNSLHHDIPDELDTLIAELLAKDPTKRPASALAVGRRLSSIEESLSGKNTEEQERLASDAPSLIIKPNADPNTPTKHDRSSALTELPTHAAKAPQASISSIDLLAETKDKTRLTAEGNKPNGIDATTEHPRSLSENDRDIDTSQLSECVTAAKKQTPKTVNAEDNYHKSAEHEIPLHHRPTKQATGSADKQTTSNDIDLAAETLVDKPERRFVTVEDLDNAARRKNDQNRSKLVRIDTLITFITVALGLMAAYWVTRPKTADQLFQTITAESQSADPDLRSIRAELDQFLDQYPADKRADSIASLLQELRVDILEARMRRRVIGPRNVSAIERDYRSALTRETESPTAALEAMEAVLTLYPHKQLQSGDMYSAVDYEIWLELIQRQIKRLELPAKIEQEEDIARATKVVDKATELYDQALVKDDSVDVAKLLEQSRRMLQSVIQTYGGRPHAREIVQAAERALETTTRNTAERQN